MSWFDHLALTGSSLAARFKGKECLLLTRAGMSLEDLAALEKELDCRFTVLRPAARVRKLGGPFRRLKGLCWSARVPDFSWCAEQDQDFVSPLRIREHGLALGPRRFGH